jgi:hypothetical protein
MSGASSSGQYKITNRIGFNNKLKGLDLSNKEIQMLIDGLRWVSGSIESKIEKGTYIVVELTKTEFAETDIQSEGFYYGIAKWAAEHFDFPMPDYTVDYSNEERKYIFPDLKVSAKN